MRDCMTVGLPSTTTTSAIHDEAEAQREPIVIMNTIPISQDRHVSIHNSSKWEVCCSGIKWIAEGGFIGMCTGGTIALVASYFGLSPTATAYTLMSKFFDGALFGLCLGGATGAGVASCKPLLDRDVSQPNQPEVTYHVIRRRNSFPSNSYVQARASQHQPVLSPLNSALDLFSQQIPNERSSSPPPTYAYAVRTRQGSNATPKPTAPASDFLQPSIQIEEISETPPNPPTAASSSSNPPTTMAPVISHRGLLNQAITAQPPLTESTTASTTTGPAFSNPRVPKEGAAADELV